jgi:hypothetical protein
MDRGAKNITVFKDHGAKMAADPNRDIDILAANIGVVGNRLLHLAGSIQSVVCGGKSRHDLVAHGLDDGATVIFGGLPHHIDAMRHRVPGAYITEYFVKLRTADDVCEKYGEFYFFAHSLCPSRSVRQRNKAGQSLILGANGMLRSLRDYVKSCLR